MFTILCVCAIYEYVSHKKYCKERDKNIKLVQLVLHKIEAA